MPLRAPCRPIIGSTWTFMYDSGPQRCYLITKFVTGYSAADRENAAPSPRGLVVLPRALVTYALSFSAVSHAEIKSVAALLPSSTGALSFS